MYFKQARVKPSTWERYVLDFIQRFSLDDDQSQKAVLMLRECQREGNQYLSAKKSAFVDVQDAMAKARASEDPTKLEQARQMLSGLQRPIDAIFEQNLKPRLEKLPTRRQREAAADREAATSKPAAR